MIRDSSLRWRLVAWVGGVLLLALAVTFAVVYVETGHRLRDEVDDDVHGDLAQLVETARALPAGNANGLATRLRGYVRARPFSGASSVLFAVIPGRATVSNHPELFGAQHPDRGESPAAQARENAQGRALLAVPDGLHTLTAPDVGPVRLDVRTLTIEAARVRLGAGEPLLEVTRAQQEIARAFLLAGAAALVLVLVVSYLAAAAVLAPLRRLAAIAQRVQDGDLAPRMDVSPSAGREINVLARSFNHMLDALTAVLARQRAFVADASHELRTPLTVIAGQLEVLAGERDPAPREIARVQRLVAAEVTRTSRLVDDLLLLARSEQNDFLRPETIDLRPFIDDLWAATGVGHARRFELTPVPEITLFADPDRLAQAIRNLTGNAIAHTQAPDGLVRLEAVADLDSVRFAVIDDGPGIAPEERERIFERFHRPDTARTRATGGAGLGLAIVRAIAEAHGGWARALTPASGNGAQVELVMPFRPRADGPAMGASSDGPRCP